MRFHLNKLISITPQWNQRESISRSKHVLYVINFMLLLHSPLKLWNEPPLNLLQLFRGRLNPLFASYLYYQTLTL